MKVLHVINRLCSTGGAETSLRQEIIGTQGAQVRHGVAVLWPDNNRMEEMITAGVPVYPPKRAPRTPLHSVRHVVGAITDFQPDLVHTSLFDANFAGRLGARISRVPVITSLVNTPYVSAAISARAAAAWKERLVRAVDAFLSRHATDSFHAISRTVADAAVEGLGIDQARIRVVPRFRDPERLGQVSIERRSAVRAALHIPIDATVLLNVARHEAQKGLEVLIDALEELQSEVSELHLVQAGREGNQTPALRSRVRSLRLENHVQLLGVRDDIGDLLAAADVFVFPSYYEGLGGAILEAMALGTPIVATRVPALEEALDWGRCGLLVPPGDPSALASGVRNVLADTEATQSRARAAMMRFGAVYSADVGLRQMRDLYLAAGTVSTQARH